MRVSVKTVCDREDASFNKVSCVTRMAVVALITDITSSIDVTSSCTRLSTNTRPSGDSRISVRSFRLASSAVSLPLLPVSDNGRAPTPPVRTDPNTVDVAAVSREV
eukprot:CAMPEP_0179918126 /NCGR_PEP_ID=MMETSP0983-20121128/3222_1 /TAXON_ID=483367 /ORGANISM="non described non described, Strain CCMP 2436" /LENGTH=105 /DNA_ID=CAMNT_0021820951 /DNA_START=531 /DNA_END=848 /DNA_ORIENTATION=+